MNYKTVILSFVLLQLAVSLYAQSSLEVKVKNIKGLQGTIRVGLFTTEDDFLKNAAEGKVVKATAEEVTVLFENLKSRDYALSVIHDANENGELDTNMVGIPKEGFAFGNNSMGMFGPPDFDDAKVVLKPNEKVFQEIELKYL